MLDWLSTPDGRLFVSVLAKLGISVLLGGLVGLERELHGRPAGIRTHMLVALGATLFSEVSRAFAPSDAARIAAQIVTGIGFLGAGTILRTGGEVRGLTSAASIWAVAAIAMAVSLGGVFLAIATTATVLALATLRFVYLLENRIAPSLKEHDLIIALDSRDRLAGVCEAIQKQAGRIGGVRILRDDASSAEIELELHGSAAEMMRAVTACPGVLAASWKK